METHSRLSQVMKGMGESYELLYINDCSKDKTPFLLNELAEKDKSVRVVHFAANRGHQIAVSAGLQYSAGQAVVIIDADLQDPPEVIPQMAERWRQGIQVVYGQRLSRKGETAFKKWTAHLYYRLLRSLAGDIFPRDVGDFRLVDRRVVDTVLAMPEHSRYLRGMFAWAGFKQEALPYNRDARFAGETHYPLRKMLKLAANGVISFSDKPLGWASLLGVLWGGLAFLFLLIALFTGAGLVYLSALIALGLCGLQLSLGILGAYLARTYEEVKGRPLFTVLETRGFQENQN